MKTAICSLVLALIASTPIRAAVLDFERINGAVPVEGMAITNQFQPYYGITFERSDGYWPYFAKIGYPSAAFVRNSGPPDTMVPADAAAIGQFFVTIAPDGSGGGAGVFITLKFDAGVSNVSGHVLDVDGTESVFIRAYTNINGAGTFASVSIAAGDPNTGDGVATPWQISWPTKDIRRVELRGGGFNVGWDNISSDYVPTNAPAPQIGIRMLPGITIAGLVGRPYRVDYADKLDITAGRTNWHPLATNFLPNTPYLLIDTNAVSGPARLYQAVALP